MNIPRSNVRYNVETVVGTGSNRPFHSFFQLLTWTSWGKSINTTEKSAFNPLGPKSVQHQFSPNISRSTRVKVVGITKLITKG